MNKTVSVSCTCPFCGKTTEVKVPALGYRLWQEGVLIQSALPDLCPADRETLISGLCLDCQVDAFMDEEEEEEE